MHNIFDLMTEPRFKDILVQYSEANTDEEKKAVLAKQRELDVSMSPVEREKYQEEILASFDNILKAIDADIEELKAATIRKKMGDLTEAVSFAYIAKNYFGKSYSWFIQRLNGSKVNGKEVHFNREEVKQLQMALNDLGNKLSNIALI